MTSIKVKAVPLSDSESDGEDLFSGEKKLKLQNEKEEFVDIKKRKAFIGGIVVSTEDENKDQSASASMSAAEKKGLKEVEELERELDLKNTFSRETNRRDEDAEMNKYIDDQIRLRREEAKRQNQSHEASANSQSNHKHSNKQEDDLSFALPNAETDKIEDILLLSLSKHLTNTGDEKSEAMLSSQMLNGIPEVDLGINEKIRTIEATEEAKLKMATAESSRRQSAKTISKIPANYSSNFKQHRSRYDANSSSRSSDRSHGSTSSSHQSSSNPREKFVTEAVVVVGEEPSEIEYKLPVAGERPPPKGKASDNYYLSRFKKNNRK